MGTFSEQFGDQLIGLPTIPGSPAIEPQYDDSEIPHTGSIPASLIPNPFDRIAAYLRCYSRTNGFGDTMFDRLCREELRCLEGVWFIRDVHQRKIPMRNRMAQAMLMAAAFDQAADGLPIRIRVLKSRKTGISTKVQQVFVDLCTFCENQTARTLAHEKGATKDIFRIGRFAAAKRACADNEKPRIKIYEIEWRGTTGSEYSCGTAGGTAVGAGSTPNLLHISEGPKHGLNKHSTRYNSTTAVPDVGESMIVEEFTAKGRDEYYVSWCEANADPTHPYKAIFIPWFADEECCTTVPDGFERTDEEDSLVVRARKMGYELCDGQLEWRRRKIKGMPGGEVIFRQEYPSSPEEAVMGASGLVVRGLRDCLVTELPFNPDYCPHDELVGGIDPGYSDPFVIWSGVYREGILWLIDYYRRVKGLSKDHVVGLLPNHTYYCDPPALDARMHLQAEANQRGLNCKFISAPRRRGVGEDPKEVETRALIDFVDKGKLRILVSIAPQLICEADTYEWNPKTAKPISERNEIVGHYDSIDALRYLIMGINLRERVIYPKLKSDDRDYVNRRGELLACA